MKNIVFALLGSLLIAACQSYSYDLNKKHHTPDGFVNNYNDVEREDGLGGFLDWRWERLSKDIEEVEFPIVDNDPQFLQQNRTESTLTWIGHATFLLQYEGLNILTDPHFTKRASPVDFAGPSRHTKPGLALKDLPPIDVVIISHNHYDHLDLETVQLLHEHQKDNPPQYFVPLGLKTWFLDLGVRNVEELDWWDSKPFQEWKIHAVPVQHFSGRSLSDRDKTLWAGWVLEHPNFKFFFAGDTGYSRDFADIGKRFGGFDLSAIPIGAYDPEWFMKPVHVNPEEAVKIHQDVKSRYSVGMHWGTFTLTDEPMEEPPQRLAKALEAQSIPPEFFFVMQHGETRRLAKDSQIAQD